MANQKTGVPHALQAAAKAVIKSAKKTTKKYRKGKSAKQNPVEAIRRFTKALCRNRESSKELERRATLVASESKQGTSLRNRIDDAFDCYQKQEKPRGRQSPAKQQLIRRLEPKADFWFASELTDFIKTINQAMRRGIIPRPCADLFALMGEEAERLADDASDVEADGCYFIFHLHPENADSDPAESSMPVLASRPGTAHLTSIASAVESLVAWAGQHKKRVEGKKKKPQKKRGRQTPDPKTLKDDAEFLAQWERAHEHGVYMGDFAKDIGRPLTVVTRRLNTIRKRNKRADKKTRTQK